MVLRGIVNRYYETVYHYIAGKLSAERVTDEAAVLDLCDATFRALLQNARGNFDSEPDSLIELLHSLADEKTAAFFDVLPFTSHPCETAAFEEILTSARQRQMQNRTLLAGGEQPTRQRRRWFRFIPFASRMRSKILQLGLVLLLVGVLSQARPLKRFAFLSTRPDATVQAASLIETQPLPALSNAAREEGRKPWLADMAQAPRPETGKRMRQPESSSASRLLPKTSRRSKSGRVAGSSRTSNRGTTRPVAGNHFYADVAATSGGRLGQAGLSSNAFLASLPTNGEPSPLPATASTDGLLLTRPRHPRDPRLVHEIVKGHSPAIQDCYKRALKRKPDLQGKLVVRFTIGIDGRVTRAELISSTLSDAELERCVLKRIRRWNDFPEAPPEYGEVRFVQEYKFGIE